MEHRLARAESKLYCNKYGMKIFVKESKEWWLEETKFYQTLKEIEKSRTASSIWDVIYTGNINATMAMAKEVCSK